jgi:hypothetical protein
MSSTIAVLIIVSLRFANSLLDPVVSSSTPVINTGREVCRGHRASVLVYANLLVAVDPRSRRK